MAKQVHRIANGEFPRRRFIQTSGLGALTASLPGLLQSQGLAGPSTDSAITRAAFGKAKQFFVLFLSGGPPQHETFDPKPLAPLEIRGPFKPIQTNVSGIHFS